VTVIFRVTEGAQSP